MPHAHTPPAGRSIDRSITSPANSRIGSRICSGICASLVRSLRDRHLRLPRQLLAATLLGLAGLGGCQSQGMRPPPGAISADRVLGDILVRFSAPDVTTSVEAGSLLAKAEGSTRFVVKRPLSGGTWLVTALSPDSAATLDQALVTLRAMPRVASADLERKLQPSRSMPTGRDMPADNKMP